MKFYFLFIIFLTGICAGCKSKQDELLIPDLRPNFLQLLNQKDSTLALDSFYFIRTDTMTEKRALIHQRFPFTNILEKINEQLEKMSVGRDSFHSAPSANDLQTIEYLNGEKKYVIREIDSISKLIVNADSISPIGYRAFFKVTVSRKDKFVVSDTIPYAISLKMQVSDWDRNLVKIIDSLSVGRRLH
jgi:hypothetical protein